MAGMDYIDLVHQRHCPAQPKGSGARCKCTPSYRVQVWDPRARKLHRKTFRVLAEAKSWRDDVKVAVRKGTIRPATSTTVAEAARALVEGMRDGTVLDRTGKPYKPSTCRSYEQALRTYILPDLGAKALSDVRRADVQAFVDRLRMKGLSASTIHNKLDPLRVIFRRAVRRDDIAIDPTVEIDMPAIRSRPRRVVDRTDAAVLLEALPDGERALWATAFYAGLRRGELRALRWSDVNLATEPAVIHVRRTWDDYEGELLDPKTVAGVRTVPLTARLRKLIVEHGLATRRGGDDLVFGRTAHDPFTPSTIRHRAIKAWTESDLTNLTPHEARHCAASYLIEAGLNDLELTETIGHSDVRTTKNIYGHLFPDSGAKIAAKLDAYLDA